MTALPVLDPKVASIDVGSVTLQVSIAENKPQTFGTIADHLHVLRNWLKAQDIHDDLGEGGSNFPDQNSVSVR